MRLRFMTTLFILAAFFGSVFAGGSLEKIYELRDGYVWGFVINQNGELFIKMFKPNNYPYENFIGSYNSTNITFYADTNTYYVEWSFDKKYLYSLRGENSNSIENHFLIRHNPGNGKKDIIFQTNASLYSPKTVKDPNKIYILIDTKVWDSEVCKVHRYDIVKKEFSQVILPVKDLVFWDNYAVSPNEKMVVFHGTNHILYFIDLEKQKVIQHITNHDPEPQYFFKWKDDSSYLVFRMGQRKVYKYTPPREFWDK